MALPAAGRATVTPVRGHYKIFVGMAAGVGKTYRMLQDGHAEAEAGRDVVGALIETHGRAATIALLDGLRLLPTRPVTYRGTRVQRARSARRSCDVRPTSR